MKNLNVSQKVKAAQSKDLHTDFFKLNANGGVIDTI